MVYRGRTIIEHVHVPVIYCVCDVLRLRVLHRPAEPVVPVQKADLRVVEDNACFLEIRGCCALYEFR